MCHMWHCNVSITLTRKGLVVVGRPFKSEHRKYKHYFLVIEIGTVIVIPQTRFFTQELYLLLLKKVLSLKSTHLTNIQMPVFSIALEIPFHEASMEYFCFAVSGSRGSVAGGGPSDSAGGLFPLRSEAANLPNWQPMAYHKGMLCHHFCTLFLLMNCHFTFQIIFRTLAFTFNSLSFLLFTIYSQQVFWFTCSLFYLHFSDFINTKIVTPL